MKKNYIWIIVLFMVVYGIAYKPTNTIAVYMNHQDALMSTMNTSYRDIKFPFLDGMNNDKYHISRVTEHDGSDRHAVDFGTYTHNIPIYAMHGGEIVCVEDNKYSGCWGGSGGSITIDHKDGYCSLYWHLQYGSMVVRVGDHVKQGQMLANSDATGNANGNHLHTAVFSAQERSCTKPKVGNPSTLEIPIFFDELCKKDDGTSIPDGSNGCRELKANDNNIKSKNSVPTDTNLAIEGSFTDQELASRHWKFLGNLNSQPVHFTRGRLILEEQGSSYLDLPYRFLANSIVEVSFKLNNSGGADARRAFDIFLRNLENPDEDKVTHRFEVPITQTGQEKEYKLWIHINKEWKGIKVEFYTNGHKWELDDVSLTYLDPNGEGKLILDRGKDQGFNYYFCDPNSFVPAGTSPLTAPNQTFCDIPPYQTFFDEILKLVNRGVVTGYSDLQYHPDIYLSRGQAAKLIVLGMEGGDQIVLADAFAEEFSDVKKCGENGCDEDETPFFAHIMYLKKQGIIGGRGDGTFGPNEEITREEFAKIITLARNKKFPQKDPEYCGDNPPNPGYIDINEESSSFYRYVACLTDRKVVNGQIIDGQKKFLPTEFVTRGQAAKFIYNGLVQHNYTDDLPDDNSDNNQTDSGAQIGEGEEITENIPSGDQDNHQINTATALIAADANGGQSINVTQDYLFTVSDQGMNADVKLEILNSSGQPITSKQQDAKEGPFALRIALDPGQRYYARVTNTNPYAVEGANYKLRLDAADSAPIVQPTDYTIHFDPFLKAHCGDGEYKYVELEMWTSVSRGQRWISGKLSKCGFAPFDKNGRFWLLRDGQPIGDTFYYEEGKMDQIFGVQVVDPQDYNDARAFQVKVQPDEQSEYLYTGVVRAWRVDEPSATTHRYNTNTAAGCGPGNYIRLDLSPDDLYQRMRVIVTPCNGGDFASDGLYWITLDGVRKWGPFTEFAGNDKSRVYIDPFGAGIINTNSTREYRIELVSDNDPDTVKQSNIAKANVIREVRTTVLALRNGQRWNDIQIWFNQHSGSPDGNGFYETMLQGGSGPWRFFLAQVPGYTIDYSAEPIPVTSKNGVYGYDLATGDQLVVNYIKECHRLIQVANPDAGGRVTVTPAPNCGTNRYEHGTSVTVTASPNSEYSFGGWGGDVSGSAQSITLTMDDSKVVAATFAPPCYTLTINRSPAASGTVTADPAPNCSNGRYQIGTEITLAAVPATDQSFTHWSSDAYGASPTTTVAMYSNKTVVANFESLYTKGEVSCDSQVDVVDAMYILQHDVGLRSAVTQCPLATDTLLIDACDVNNDNACNSIDALFVMQCNVGLSNVFCPAFVAADVTSEDYSSATGRATIYTDPVITDVDGLLHLPIKAILTAGTLGAATIEMRYDSVQWEVISCEADPATVFDLALCNSAYDSDGSDMDSLRLSVLSTTGVTDEMLLGSVVLRPLSTNSNPTMEIHVPALSDTAGLSLDVTAPQNIDDSTSTEKNFLPIVQR